MEIIAHSCLLLWQSSSGFSSELRCGLIVSFMDVWNLSFRLFCGRSFGSIVKNVVYCFLLYRV